MSASSSNATAPAVSASTSINLSSSSFSASHAVKKPSPQTLALRKQVKAFIDAEHQVWKEQPKKDIGTLATPAVLEAVKKTSTAFHCNSSGGVDLLWLKKDMPREALKHAETDYWTAKAGPGPKHEQEEMVAIHSVPREVIETIRRSNDHDLISSFLYAYIDFWNLVEYHILIWIACIFFSGTICIIQPILLVCESSKIYRLFHDDYFVNIYQGGLARELFQLFLTGQFDFAFLQALCVITIIIIIWDDLPLSPPDWLHCYGIPVVVNYGPFPEHVAILIPKQHPYRPYHTMTLSADYIDLDRCARLIIEVARKIVAAAPSPPSDEARRRYMVKLRMKIIQECVRLGLWSDLEAEKKKLRTIDESYRHHAMSSAWKKAKDATDAVGAPERMKEIRSEAGKKAIIVRNERAIRAEGKPGSKARVDWAVGVLDDLRRKIEMGRMTQLLACPRGLQHGTIEHAQWLILTVGEGADIINSASGTKSFATPSTEKDQEARDLLQDKAGAAKVQANSFTKSAIDILKVLAAKPSPPISMPFCAATCPHCAEQWLVDTAGNRAVHTCSVARGWYLPVLHTSHKKTLEALAEAEEDLKAVQATTESSEALEMTEQSQVTRVAVTGFLPWTVGESIVNDELWESLLTQKAPKGKAKERRTMNDPLYERAMDLRGRLSHLCLKLDTFTAPAELLSHPLATSLFINGTPAPIKGINFIDLQAFLKEKDNEGLITNANVDQAALAAIPSSPTIWLAVSADMSEEVAKKAVLNQIAKYLQQKTMKCTPPRVSKDEIETAAQERIARRKLRPYFFNLETGVDDYKPITAVVLSASSSTAPAASTSSS